MSSLLKRPLALVILGVLCFHLAYELPGLSLLIIGYLAALVGLSQVERPRRAFAWGLLVGYGVVVPQLWFFAGLFKGGAITLWTVLAAWIAAFVLLGHLVCRRWPRWGIWLLPLLWTGLEYTRSELYYLRFAWLTPGLALEAPTWHGWLAIGQYGFGLGAMILVVLAMRRPRWAMLAATALALVVALRPQPQPAGTPLTIVGVQMEFPDEGQMMRMLGRALDQAPDADLVVLPEYTLQEEVPEKLRAWCREHRKHLIVGGKAYTDASLNEFDNTAFVIGPTGETVFSQVKAVPIQFFNDGRPATSQSVWQSPWGKIGIAICYDFSFSRVMDPLVREGAQLLVVPTMDVIDWGRHQHELHSRLGPIRAREYSVPVVRAASSGVSQICAGDGRVLAQVPVSEKMSAFHATVLLPAEPSVPIDRHLAPICVLATLITASYLLLMSLVSRFAPLPGAGQLPACH
jgi:apolipoprotein N-acyltransferase